MKKLVLGGYIMLVVGMSIPFVGTVLKCDNEPVTWKLPFVLFSMLVFCAVWGYAIGREEK